MRSEANFGVDIAELTLLIDSLLAGSVRHIHYGPADRQGAIFDIDRTASPTGRAVITVSGPLIKATYGDDVSINTAPTASGVCNDNGSVIRFVQGAIVKYRTQQYTPLPGMLDPGSALHTC